MTDRSRSLLPWGSRGLAVASLVWIAFAAADLAMVWNDASIRVLEAFPPLDRVILVGWELVALAPLSLLLGFAVDRISRIGGTGTGSPRSRGGLAAGALLGGVAGLLFGASWLAFLATGEFLNGTGLRLWLANPVQIARHAADMMSATLLAALPLFAVLGAAVLGYGVPRAADRLSEASRRSLNRKVALVSAILLVLGALGEVRSASGTVRLSDPEAGRVYSVYDRYRQVGAERTGPAARALATIWNAARGRGSHGLPTSDEIEVRRDSIEPPDRWVARATAARPPEAEEQSVIVVLVESLRADQLEAYGSPRSVMPNVDSLARESRVFLDAYTQSSHSNYADLPPLDSHYPLRSPRMHVYPENPPYPRVLLYDLLKRLGYRTAIFSSQNEHWGGMANYLRTGSLDRFVHAATYEGRTYIPEGDPGFAEYVRTTSRAGKIDDRATVEAAVEWIGADRETPFFMYMNLQNSHAPYRTPEGFPRRFGPDSIDFDLRFAVFPPEKADVVRDLYANSLAYVDHQLGKLFRALREDGRWGNTVVVISGDTGQAFYEHGFAAHAGPLYDEVTRVPLVVRAPWRVSGRDSTPAEHVDVPPTILDLLGLPPHPSFQGHSLLGASRPSHGGRYLVAQSPLAHQYAVVRDGWKLIRDVRRDRSLLFNLEEDPGETVNLAEEVPERREELERRLGSWVEAQIRYYGTPSLHSRWYPPKLVPAGALGNPEQGATLRHSGGDRPSARRLPDRPPR